MTAPLPVSDLTAVMSIGEQIKAVRTAKGMSQRHLAHLLSTTQSAISEWERGDVEPGITTATRIADALDCDLVVRLVPREPSTS